MTSATVACPRRKRMFITCRSRRVRASLSFCFGMAMLIFQHRAPHVKGHLQGDRNVVRGDPSFLIVGLTAVLSADSVPEDTLTLRFARLGPRSGSAPETRSAGAPPEPGAGMPAEPVTR